MIIKSQRHQGKVKKQPVGNKDMKIMLGPTFYIKINLSPHNKPAYKANVLTFYSC